MPPIGKTPLQRSASPGSPPPGWTEQRITIVLGLAGKQSKQVDALVNGPIAIHQCSDASDFAVTHIASGMFLTLCKTRQDAYRIADILLRLTRTVLERDTAQAVYAKSPQWLKEWMRACKLARAYVDHVQYLKGGK